MPSLKQLLDELQVEIPDDDDNNNDDSKTVDVDNLPDDQKAFFKSLQSEMEGLKNTVAERDLVIKTMQNTIKNIPAQKQSNSDNSDDNKKSGPFDDLDDNDPYKKHFQTLAGMLENTASKIPTPPDPQKEFQKNVVNFVKNQKDAVRYVEEMDELLLEHPTLAKDIPKLYNLAKTMKEGREKEKGKGKSKTTNVTERSGITNSNAQPNPSNVRSINDAFEMAEKSIAQN